VRGILSSYIDRQRHAVQAPAQPGDRGRVLGHQREGGLDGRRPVGE